MVNQWVISPTYKWGIPWGYNPLILTIDPNFQRDIQVVSTFDKNFPAKPFFRHKNHHRLKHTVHPRSLTASFP